MTDSLLEAYKEQYWGVASELAMGDFDGSGSTATTVATRREEVGDGGILPHAVVLRELTNGGGSSTTRAVDVAKVARAEQSSVAALNKEMGERGAIAVLCGMYNTFFVRNHSVTLGRLEDVDIDLSEEAELCDCERAISRQQCRIFRDDSGWRLLNTGSRAMSVDGKTVTEGQNASLGTMTLISVAAVSLLFIPALQ